MIVIQPGCINILIKLRSQSSHKRVRNAKSYLEL